MNPLPYPHPTFPLSFCHATPSFLTIHTTVGISPPFSSFSIFFRSCSPSLPFLFHFSIIQLFVRSFRLFISPFFQFSRFSVSTFICRKWSNLAFPLSFYCFILLFVSSFSSIRHFYSWKSNLSFLLPFYRFSVSLLFVEDRFDLSLLFRPAEGTPN